MRFNKCRAKSLLGTDTSRQTYTDLDRHTYTVTDSHVAFRQEQTDRQQTDDRRPRESGAENPDLGPLWLDAPRGVL